jgi:hypothetical protein
VFFAILIASKVFLGRNRPLPDFVFDLAARDEIVSTKTRGETLP